MSIRNLPTFCLVYTIHVLPLTNVQACGNDVYALKTMCRLKWVECSISIVLWHANCAKFTGNKTIRSKLKKIRGCCHSLSRLKRKNLVGIFPFRSYQTPLFGFPQALSCSKVSPKVILSFSWIKVTLPKVIRICFFFRLTCQKRQRAIIMECSNTCNFK